MVNAQVRAHMAGIGENFERIDGDEPKVIFGYEGDGMWFDCEVISPPSAEGRSVHVFIPQNLIPGVFKALRDKMVYDRSKPMSDS